jgi:signal transduction histidine kinase
MPPDSSDTTACLELLQAYQASVVHDLRGDLNGLLLTLDFLRRQLAARPETATMFGDSLGDLDQVRTTLTRTLNQLEAVGHARRVVGGRDTVLPAEQNLADVVGEVVHVLSDRIRRRNVVISLPQDRDVVVRVDPVLLQLCLHRILSALVELSKNGEIRLAVNRVGTGDAPAAAKPPAVIRASVPDARQVPADLFDRAHSLSSATPQPIPATVIGIALADRLAQQLGGRLKKESGEDGSFTIVLELPVV